MKKINSIFTTNFIKNIMVILISMALSYSSKTLLAKETLETLENYIKKYPENVDSQNNDFENPNFIKFYKTNFRDSIYEYILNKFNFAKNKKNIINFEKLLDKVTGYRLNKILKNKNLIKNTEINKQEINNNINETLLKNISPEIIKDQNTIIEVRTGDKIIIFGDLHAGVHSLMRDLNELKKINILNNDLKIIKNNIYIIFIGDAINKNPYSIETLYTILLLMDANPEKLIYSQGKHEKNGYWENFSMISELKIKAERLSNDPAIETPLKDKINKFFDTLTDSIIIKYKKPEIISQNNISQNNISKENILSDNIKKDKITKESIEKEKDPEEIAIITHHECKKSLITPKTKIIIFGEKKFDIIKESSGLEFMGYISGASCWSTLSCPTKTYQKYFNFHYDSFTEFEIGENFLNSKLILHNRDVRLNGNQEFKSKIYNPIFGFEIKDPNIKIDKKEIINIGSTMPLSGPTGTLGRENKIGLETAIYTYNNNINNINKNYSKNLIKLSIFDDENSQKLALKNIQKLINNYNTNTILFPSGNINISKYEDLIKSGKIYVFFPSDGSKEFRKKELKNIIHFKPSYEQEVITLIKYLTNEYGIKNFAFFYQNDVYGKSMVDIAHLELKKLGLEKWLDLPHLKTESTFTYLIKNIKRKMPEAICCFSNKFATQELITQLGGSFFYGRILAGTSMLYSNAFDKFLNYRKIEAIFTLTVPYNPINSPINSPLEITKEFKKDITLQGFTINPNSLEGYITGKLFTHAIEKLNEKNPEKIMNFFEKFNKYNFMGLELTFNPETRDLGQPVFIKNNNKLIKY